MWRKSIDLYPGIYPISQIYTEPPSEPSEVTGSQDLRGSLTAENGETFYFDSVSEQLFDKDGKSITLNPENAPTALPAYPYP
jgi:hypothetical protein